MTESVYTYFIQSERGGLIKIGKSCDVTRRVSKLQYSSPVKLSIVGVIAGDVESLLHCKFNSHRVYGEWFRPSVELLEYIALFAMSYDKFSQRSGEQMQKARESTQSRRHPPCVRPEVDPSSLFWCAELTRRTIKGLCAIGVKSLKDALCMTKAQELEFLNVPGVGFASYEELKAFLANHSNDT